MVTKATPIDSIRNLVASAFAKTAPNRVSLVLDGTGVNGALQYSTLAAIGYQRLLELESVQVISASTYAYLCFLAFHQQQLSWDRVKLAGWSQFNYECHGTTKGRGFGRMMSWLWCGSKAKFSGSGFSKSLQGTVSESFFDQSVADLPPNVCFWLYDASENELIKVTPHNEWKHMPLEVLIRSAPAVPYVFAPAYYKGRIFSDPVFCDHARQMYRSISASSSEVILWSNIMKNGTRGKAIYIKTHQYDSGRLLLARDFWAFLAGRPNPRIAQAIDDGLFRTEEA